MGKSLSLYRLMVIAPNLSGDGQLNELMLEQRKAAKAIQIWFLPLSLARQAWPEAHGEAVLCKHRRQADWLQLRFGGIISQIDVSPSWLETHATALPPKGVAGNISVQPQRF